MMDYKQMAEIVTKEVDAILERKRRRSILIKRVSLTASGLCAAAIVGLGVWHNDAIKNAFHHNEPLVIEDIPENTETKTTQSTLGTTAETTTAATTYPIHKTTNKTTSVQAETSNTATEITSASSTTEKNVLTTQITTASSETENISTALTVSVSEAVYSYETTQNSLPLTQEITETADRPTTTSTTQKQTVTSTTPPDVTLNITTSTTSAPDPNDDNTVEIEVIVKIAAKDIDTNENIDGVNVSFFRNYSISHRTIVQNITLGNEISETLPINITLYKGSTAQFGVCIGKIPPDYELVQEDPNNYDYYSKYVEFTEDPAEVPEIIFYLRKIEFEELQ